MLKSILTKKIVIILNGLIFILICGKVKTQSLDRRHRLLYGVSSSAYQIEGAWNTNNKGPNMWDTYLHKNSSIVADKTNGDITCDSYNKIDEDIKIIQELGVNFYRFSLSWSRILPNGKTTYINSDGVRYYTHLLNSLKKINVDAMVTILHFDIPTALLKPEKGKFDWEEFANDFVAYSRLMFTLFGKKVKYWLTINEPTMLCDTFQFIINDVSDTKKDMFKCVHFMLLAHARIYRMYHEEFKPLYNGKVSVTLNGKWFEPATRSNSDRDAAERARLFSFGWFFHPLVFGDYPEIMKETIHHKKSHGHHIKFYKFNHTEKKLLKGAFDLLTLNHYETLLAKDGCNHKCEYELFKIMDVNTFADPEWEDTGVDPFKITPWALKKLLIWIDRTFQHPVIIITENGYGSKNDVIHDKKRVEYLSSYLFNAKKAIHNHNVKLIGYSPWSLLDSFEWVFGYTVKFGLYHVNFSSPNRERTPKLSAKFYSRVIKQN